jgi:hypothetical protein
MCYDYFEIRRNAFMYGRDSRSVNKAFAALAIVFIGLVAYVILDRERVADWLAGDAIEKETTVLKEKIKTLEEELSAEMQEPAPATAPAGGGPKADEVSVLPKAAGVSCRQMDKDLADFFGHLDSRDYVKAYGIRGGSYGHFRSVLPDLMQKTPVVANETDNLLRVLKNSAHFFRTMDRKDLALSLEILAREDESIERLFALLYQVAEGGDRCVAEGLDTLLPLEGAYEYAGFFLDTLGGRSYLMRRDSRVRMLVQYYSILVVDLANSQNKNKYGIDLRTAADSLVRDMQSSINLQHRGEYLYRLESLREKYRSLYGSRTESLICRG